MVHYNKKYTELNMHTAHNKRVSGFVPLGTSPKSFASLRTSYTRRNDKRKGIRR